MISIDIRTLMFILMISSMICTWVLFQLWIQNRDFFLGLHLWVADFAIKTTGTLLLVLRGFIPDTLSVLAANILLIAATITGYAGLQSFFEKKNAQVQNYALLLVFAIIHSYLLFIHPHTAARTFNVVTVSALVYLQYVWFLFYGIEPAMRPLVRNLKVVFIGFSLVCMIQMIIIIFIPNEQNFYHSAIHNKIMLVSFQMLVLLQTYSLTLMTNQRMRQNLQGEIEARHQAEKSLRENEARLKAITNHLPSTVIYQLFIKSDGTRQFSYLSDTVKQLHGILPEEGMADASLMYKSVLDEDAASLTKDEEKASKTLSTFRRDIRIKDAAGKSRWVTLASTPHVLGDGLVCWDGIEMDITERKAMEEELRESEEKYRAILDNILEGYFETDLQGNILFCNDAACAIMGYTKEELCRMNYRRFSTDETKRRLQQIYGNVFQTGKPNKLDDYEIVRKDGTIRIHQLNVVLIRDAAGHPAGFRTVARDITERRVSEDELKKYSHNLNERVKELNCILSVSDVVRKSSLSQAEMFHTCAVFIAQAYQFPEISVCRIIWENQEYGTHNFQKSPWFQTASIRVSGRETGKIEVCYLEERPAEFEGPFLRQERNMLNNLAELIGKSTERRQLEKERENLIAELQKALSEIKILGGLLPICASCKKIRNDSGYWEQIETYITERSDAVFSHGICPECMKRLYPNL